MKTVTDFERSLLLWGENTSGPRSWEIWYAAVAAEGKKHRRKEILGVATLKRVGALSVMGASNKKEGKRQGKPLIN